MFQCSPALIRLAALATFPEGKVWGAYRPAAVCNDRRGGRLEMNLEQMIRNYDHAEKEKRN